MKACRHLYSRVGMEIWRYGGMEAWKRAGVETCIPMCEHGGMEACILYPRVGLEPWRACARGGIEAWRVHLISVYLIGRVPHGCVRHRRASHGVYLINGHLTDMHLMGVYLTGLHFMGVHLTGVYLMGVHLIGVYLMVCASWRVPHGVYLMACISWVCTS
jgi:hypothetical protein